MKLAMIIARGGSKRIPRKNIRAFCGKPIIAYSIRAALESACFDEVMVSTDDAEIAEIASQYGANIPFMRSAKNSSDYSTTADVMLEVIKAYQQKGMNPEFACCIYPTAPFVTANNLKSSLDILIKNNLIETVIPVTRFSYPIQRALKMNDNKISMFQPEHLLTRSQDLEPAYHDAGQFYWVRVKEFLSTPKLMGLHTAGIVLPEWQVQDIDNENDWLLAEMKYHFIQQHSQKEVA